LKTDILLSTFNGASFLDDLIRSLYGQTYTDWHLLVRDDGSSDRTPELLKSYYDNDKDRITLLEGEKKQLGPKKSFEYLLQQSEADYILFCDQDDVWLPHKIETTLAKMQELESHYPGAPALVFTDLTVVDKMLREIHSSFWEYMKTDPANILNIYRLLVNNPVVGCTVMINKKVKELVLPFPEEAVMHDWWVALKISQKGVADYIDRPTVLYRLHASNNVGAYQADRKYYVRRLTGLPKTFSQNINAVRMLRKLDFRLSVLKFTGYKIQMTLSKLL